MEREKRGLQGDLELERQEVQSLNERLVEAEGAAEHVRRQFEQRKEQLEREFG